MKRNYLNNLSHHFINNYAMQIESHEGVASIIVPVTMMVEGVHSGSRGPLLYTEYELTQSASNWNGFPVVVNHPENEEGNPMSASNVEADQIVGVIFNSHMEGKRLKASLRINPTNLENVSSDTLQVIQNNQPLEVSIGVFSDNEEVSGEFNNKSYIAIAHNLTPDHLALLPNDTGACSVDDGCGLRNNKLNKSGTKIKNNEVVERNKLTVKEMHSLLLAKGFVINELTESELTQNEIGFYEISNSIQLRLDAFDSDNKYHYLQEVFLDNSFVYSVRNRETRTSKLYRRSYQVNNDQIVLLDDAVEVVREVNYPVVTPSVNKFIRTKKSKEKIMSKKVSTCQVDALIANEASKFGEDDREFLEGLDEPMFNKMSPEEKKEVEVIDNTSKKKEVNQEEIAAKAVENFFANIKSSDDYIKLMPAEMKGQTQAGLKMYNDRRDVIIKEIAVNSEFSEEVLKTWEIGVLETMHKSVVPEKEEVSDFSLNVESDLGADNTPGVAMKSMLRIEEPKKAEA